MVRFLCGRFQRREERPKVAPEDEGHLIAKDLSVTFVVPLPDGERVLINENGVNGELHLSSLRKGKLLLTYKYPGDQIIDRDLATGCITAISVVLLNNNTFASLNSEGSINVWRISDGVSLGHMHVLPYEGFLCSASLKNGYFLAGTNSDKVLEMQWCDTGKLTHTRTILVSSDYRDSGYIREISVHGNRFAVMSEREHHSHDVVALFDLASFQPVGAVNVSNASCIHLTDLLLAIGCKYGKLFVHNAVTLEIIQQMQIHSARVVSVYILTGSCYVLSVDKDGLVSIVDIEKGAPVWQKQFSSHVISASPLRDMRLLFTCYFGAIVHSIPQDLAELLIPPPTPLREALEDCISGSEVPAQKCKELIAFDRCSVSFDEWCCAHQLLMMAVADGDIARSRDYNGQISWWFKNLYLAAKEVKTANEHDVRTMERFVVQAKKMGLVEGIEPVLVSMRLTKDLKGEVRALQRMDILMLERMLNIEVRLDRMKDAFNRYTTCMRNSQLIGVALQIIPIVGGTVAGIVSVGAEVINGISAKDLTDYFLGLGSDILQDEVSSMSERIFSNAAFALSPEMLNRMSSEHREKLEKGVISCGLSLRTLRELFVERAKDVREATTADSAANVSGTFRNVNALEASDVIVEETEEGLESHILDLGTGQDTTSRPNNMGAGASNDPEVTTDRQRNSGTQRPSYWKGFELGREGIRDFSQEQLASLWAACIVCYDDTRQAEYDGIQKYLVSVLREEHLFPELVSDSCALPLEEVVRVVTGNIAENGVRVTSGVKGKIRMFVSAVRVES